MRRINSKTVKAGDILLFHDDNRDTLDALPSVISELKSNGFKFVRVEG